MNKEELEMYVKQVKACIDNIQQELTWKDKKKIAVTVYYDYLAKCKIEKERMV